MTEFEGREIEKQKGTFVNSCLEFSDFLSSVAGPVSQHALAVYKDHERTTGNISDRTREEFKKLDADAPKLLAEYEKIIRLGRMKLPAAFT